MRYIQRDEAGTVIGHYAHQHPYAQEEVADDHPEVLAWSARIKAAQQKSFDERAGLLATVRRMKQDLERLKKG